MSISKNRPAASMVGTGTITPNTNSPRTIGSELFVPVTIDPLRPVVVPLG